MFTQLARPDLAAARLPMAAYQRRGRWRSEVKAKTHNELICHRVVAFQDGSCGSGRVQHRFRRSEWLPLMSVASGATGSEVVGFMVVVHWPAVFGGSVPAVRIQFGLGVFTELCRWLFRRDGDEEGLGHIPDLLQPPRHHPIKRPTTRRIKPRMRRA